MKIFIGTVCGSVALAMSSMAIAYPQDASRKQAATQKAEAARNSSTQAETRDAKVRDKQHDPDCTLTANVCHLVSDNSGDDTGEADADATLLTAKEAQQTDESCSKIQCESALLLDKANRKPEVEGKGEDENSSAAPK